MGLELSDPIPYRRRNTVMNVQQLTRRVPKGPNPSGRLSDRRMRQAASIVSFGYHVSAAVQDTETATMQAPEPVDYVKLIGLIARDRDRAAFGQVFAYFAPRVKSFLLGQGMPPAAADDVLQEVMLAVWNKASLFRSDKAAPSTWIFAIARNKRIDRIRKENKPDLDPEEPALQPSESEQADDETLQAQRQKAVAAAMAKLPEDQRSCIQLAFMKGLSHAEIAEQLDLPLGTVKSRIRLAFKRMRDQLGEVL